MVPNANAMRAALAEAYLENGQWDLAIELLNQSLEIGETLEARILLGIAQIRLGEIRDGMESLMIGLIGGEDPRLTSQAIEILLEIFVTEGENIWEFTTPQAAIEVWEAVFNIGRNPRLKNIVAQRITVETEHEIFKLLGRSYELIDEPEAAAKYYYRAAVIWWDRGLISEAKDFLERSVELVPDSNISRLAHIVLAEIAEAEMDFAAAAKHLELANP